MHAEIYKNRAVSLRLRALQSQSIQCFVHSNHTKEIACFRSYSFLLHQAKHIFSFSTDARVIIFCFRCCCSICYTANDYYHATEFLSKIRRKIPCDFLPHDEWKHMQQFEKNESKTEIAIFWATCRCTEMSWFWRSGNIFFEFFFECFSFYRVIYALWRNTKKCTLWSYFRHVFSSNKFFICIFDDFNL